VALRQRRAASGGSPTLRSWAEQRDRGIPEGDTEDEQSQHG